MHSEFSFGCRLELRELAEHLIRFNQKETSGKKSVTAEVLGGGKSLWAQKVGVLEQNSG